MTAALTRRGTRYLGVSLFCFLFNNALFILLDRAGIWYGASVAISAAVMIPLGFVLQSRATFDRGLNWPAFGRYALVMMANPPVAFALFWLFHDRGGLPMLFAAPLVTGLMLVWNFMTSSWAILSRRAGPRLSPGRE